MSAVSQQQQQPPAEVPYRFPVHIDFVNGSRYAPIVKDVRSPTLLGQYISERRRGLFHIMQNYEPIFTGNAIASPVIRFFEDIAEADKNESEKCVCKKFDPEKAAANGIFFDLSQISVESKVAMSQNSVKSSLKYTVEQQTAVRHLIQFIKLSKTIRSDALIVEKMQNDAADAESVLLAVTMPTDANRVSKLIDMFCQKAPRDVFLSNAIKCCIGGCTLDEHVQLFKVNSVCSNHQSCIDARLNEKQCNCTAAYCKHCLCNYMARCYKLCKSAVCATCNAEFCPEDLILYNVAPKVVQVKETVIEDDQPKKRAKKN